MRNVTHYQISNVVLPKLIILIAIILFISACRPVPTTDRPPNQSELQNFIQEQGITPIVDLQVDDFTVLLYEHANALGYYTISVQEPGGQFVTDQVCAARTDDPILILERLTSDQPFIAVVIQDAALVAETAAIEISIDPSNRLTATTHGQPGAILFSPSPVPEWGAVTLYNSQGQVIYSQEGYP
jgi:hypothetical protein